MGFSALKCLIYYNVFRFIYVPPECMRRSNEDKLTLSFVDHFTGRKLDTNKWDHEITAAGGGSFEFQIYSPEEQNSFIENGVLKIKPTLTADFFGEEFLTTGILNIPAIWGKCTRAEDFGCYRRGQDNLLNPIMSARLMSKFEFKYGKVEIKARAPVGDWIWPALWLLPRDQVYGDWPRSGEIDLMESRGNENLRLGNELIGVQEMGSTLHWGTRPSTNQYQLTAATGKSNTGSFGDGFHNYTLLWNEDGIKTWVDGSLILDRPTPENGYYEFGNFDSEANPWANGGRDAPFDQKFYLILNVAVGGVNGYFPDAAVNQPYPKPWLNTSPRAAADFWSQKEQWYNGTWSSQSSLDIDYVKVWTYQ